jgi:diguanylate cyclase (GGDEF)-like protein
MFNNTMFPVSSCDPARDEQVSKLLSSSQLGLRFPVGLETQFERDTGPERCKTFVRYSIASLVLYTLFLFDYFAVLPDVALLVASVQLGVFTPTAIACILYMRSNPPPFWREAAPVSWALISLISAVIIYQGSGEPAAVFFRYCPILTALYVNVVLSVRFRFAAFTSVAVLVINAVDLWAFDHVGFDLKLLINSSILWTCAMSLLANYRLEKEQRRNYLLREREQSQERRIRHLAHHDSLTGLPNRILLQERMDSALALAEQGICPVAVLYLDLDRFKVINDTLGHHAGDLLLQQVAGRLRQTTRAIDAVARMGGDEFVILQVGVCDPATISALALRVIETISDPFDLDGHPASVGTSVGIAVYPQDGCKATELLRAADAALYRAKKDSGNTFRFYKLGIDSHVHGHSGLKEDDLRYSLYGPEAHACKSDCLERFSFRFGGAVS